MAEYRYRAVDDLGQPVEGVMEEASAHRVTSILRERGLTVNTVSPVEPAPGILRVSKRMKWEEVQLFTEQLASVTRSGLPLPPAVRAMSMDLRSPRIQGILHHLHHDLERGLSFEEALARQHDAFPPLYCAIVRAGEKAGNLHGVLQMMSGYAGRMVNLKHQLQLSLAYPFMLMVVAVLIIAFLLTKVVPVYAEIFEEFGGHLPWNTKLLLFLSDVIRYHWTELLTGVSLGVIGLAVLWRLIRRGEGGRRLLESLRIRIPVMGRLYYLLSVARFARTLALLLRSGVPVVESMELAAASSGSANVEFAVGDAALHVASGERISDALGMTGYFGHNFCWLVSTGEERGEADEALDSAADMYERETAVRDRLLATFMAPTIIIITGLIVGFMVIAMYAPIFTIGDVIS